ncbi:hypothetical protein H4R99_001217 [Coemansia sp. RSA 1722]|nr:hypothetical protein LPJ57_000590 [Coemansia sp. RSA 486]KAJ2237033.1 hypothetical protein IWW45_001317 [Coemansia sp. RSA 485]KAJ2603524.1 hypothetical protein GGF39_000017 [Coemansia sp. RSA 1721]KAJ2605300.1 hypothetical protein H4R99_001217 [Coemansia sp. RSA 1722]KAJ2638674.1 hypothetical protein GGF40_001450 [Coemansia sp. RSA 1286]
MEDTTVATTSTNSAAPQSRVSGRTWKQPKKPTNRTMIHKSLRKTYDQRMLEKRDLQATKLREKVLKDAKQAEKDAVRTKIVERKKRKEEKLRQEKYEAEMSARKRMRVKRKELKARAHAKH